MIHSSTCAQKWGPIRPWAAFVALCGEMQSDSALGSHVSRLVRIDALRLDASEVPT
jgi:hypothetical protein